MPRAGIFGSARVAPVAGGPVTFQGSAVDSSDQTVYTFAARPIGAASATRRVVVASTTRTAVLASVSIGGVAASIDVDHNVSNNRVTIASAVVPSGTTADVVVTFTGTAARCGVGVWTLTAGAPTGQVGTASGAAPAASVTTSAGHVVIAAAVENGTVGTTATWTGATERYDETLEGDLTQTGAEVVASGGSTNVSIAWSATNGSTLAAAAYA